MKTVKLFVSMSIIILLLLVGGSIGYKLRYLDPDIVGTPKTELPPIGSVIRVDASFEDGTFVGTYAGKRSFYKSPRTINGRVAITLDSGKAYEVIGGKGDMGRVYTALVPIH
jgi:hypothetical protein